MRFKTIAIVGLGLMGGSLAAICRRKFPSSRILGISRNPKALAFALKQKWIHTGTRRLSLGVQNADLIVLCTPVDTFLKMLSQCDQFAPPGTLVTDVGSVKKEILDKAERFRWKRIQFVGAHPMVGSHDRGIEAANPFLYDSGFTFIIRTRKTTSQSYEGVKNFWKKITPRVVEISAQGHDTMVSEISHLPHAAAVCLVLSVSKESLRYAASGFRDVTRIAQGHPSVWLPILRANQAAIARALANFERNIRKLRRALKSRRDFELQQMLAAARKKRRQMEL